MNRYANTPDEGHATNQELIDLLFLKVSEVMQSGMVELHFDASMINGTPIVSWYVGNAIAPEAGNICDNLYLTDHPVKFRTFDETKCREWIDALHELLFCAVGNLPAETVDECDTDEGEGLREESHEDIARTENAVMDAP